MSRMVNRSFRLPVELLARLDAAARRSSERLGLRVTASDALRRALASYVEDHDDAEAWGPR